MEPMYTITATVDAMYHKPSTSFNGEKFPPVYIIQITGDGVFKDQPMKERHDIKCEESFGMHPELIGKTVRFPVDIKKSDRGLAIKLFPGTKITDFKEVRAQKAAA